MQRNFFKVVNAFKPVLTYGRTSFNFFKPSYSIPFTLTSTTLAYYMYTTFNDKIAKQEEDLKDVETISTSELNDGQMKQVQVGPTKDDVILIAKVDGKFYACGATCSHFGAPLE
mmetsp:Transcript_34973/g.31525  ORF Transcript_34973/g.31525 Transcript_34973/m.31525 type:complete len:114 (+) Transcript_34973:45-386(+)